jgi:alanyl-tRNA synthetase
MKYLSSKEIRNLFLNFFQKLNHKVEKSASLVPVNDKSLLLINSGVAAIKDFFD